MKPLVIGIIVALIIAGILGVWYFTRPSVEEPSPSPMPGGVPSPSPSPMPGGVPVGSLNGRIFGNWADPNDIDYFISFSNRPGLGYQGNFKSQGVLPLTVLSENSFSFTNFTYTYNPTTDSITVSDNRTLLRTNFPGYSLNGTIWVSTDNRSVIRFIGRQEYTLDCIQGSYLYGSGGIVTFYSSVPASSSVPSADTIIRLSFDGTSFALN